MKYSFALVLVLGVLAGTPAHADQIITGAYDDLDCTDHIAHDSNSPGSVLPSNTDQLGSAFDASTLECDADGNIALKGAAAATAGQVPISDGAGGIAFGALPPTVADTDTFVTIDGSGVVTNADATPGEDLATQAELDAVAADVAADNDGDPANELGGLVVAGDGTVTFDPTGNAAAGPVDFATQAELDAAVGGIASGVSTDAGNSLADGSDGLPFFAHAPSALAENGDGTCTHDNGDGTTTDFICAALLLNDDFVQGDDAPYLVDTIINPVGNDFIVRGIASQTLVPSTNSNVAVTFNADNTHTIRVFPVACSAGFWDYEYEVTDNDGRVDTAIVTGLLDTEPKLIATVPNSAGSGDTHNLRITLLRGTTYSVDWDGDGTIDSVDIPSGDPAAFTYGAAFDGETAIYVRGCDSVTEVVVNNSEFSGPLSALTAQMPDLEFLSMTDDNTVGGSIANAVANTPKLSLLRVTGDNKLTGDIEAALAQTPLLETLAIRGDNTIGGNLDAAVANTPLLGYIQLDGNNRVSGDVALIGDALSNLSYFFVQGVNTLEGDVVGLLSGQSVLELVNVGGSNTVTGDLGTALAGLNLVEVINFTGSNTVSGLIEDVTGGGSTLITSVNLQGANTVSGNFNAAMANTPLLEFLILGGGNTVAGNGTTASSLTPLATTWVVAGNSTIGWSAPTWGGAASMVKFTYNGVGRTQAQVDRVLEGLANDVTAWTGVAEVDVAGSNPAPSAAGAAFIPTITAAGASSVATN